MKKEKIIPLRDIVAITWNKPKLKSKLDLPDFLYKTKMEPGRFYVAKVIVKGPKCWQVSIGDYVLVHEYATLNFQGQWEEDKIYYVKEEDCKAIIKNWAVNQYIIERKLTKGMD